MIIRKIFVASITISCGLAYAAQDQSDFSLPAPTASGNKQHQLWATHYFVHIAPSTPTGIAFKDKAGNAISDKVSWRDWCLAAIEGTVQVTMNGQPRTLNYGGIRTQSQVDCAATLKIDSAKNPWVKKTGKSYFTAATGAYGDGVRGYRLIPFRTVAVDSKTLPYGTIIFIPKARGAQITLPSGSVVKHDGYFFAGDTGGAIKGTHIDVFCGTHDKNCFPAFITSDEKTPFVAMEVNDEAVIQNLTTMHKK